MKTRLNTHSAKDNEVYIVIRQNLKRNSKTPGLFSPSKPTALTGHHDDEANASVKTNPFSLSDKTNKFLYHDTAPATRST